MSPALLSLPTEILLLIAEQLPLGAINALSQTNRRLLHDLDDTRIRSAARARRPLCWAARHNDVALTRRLLEYGADVNNCDHVHHGPLAEAVGGRSHAVAALLLKHGAIIETLRMFQKPKDLLSVALRNADGVFTDPRIAARPDAADLTPDDSHNLYDAWPLDVNTVLRKLRHGDVEMLEMLLHANPNMCLDAKYKSGTALHDAERRVDIAVMRVLLKHGANPDAVTEDGDTVLQQVSERLPLDPADCRDDANVSETERQQLARRDADKGRARSQRETRKGARDSEKKAMFRLLIEHGANAALTNDHRDLPLVNVARFPALDDYLVQRLEHTAFAGINARESLGYWRSLDDCPCGVPTCPRGSTILCHAAGAGNTTLVRYLLAHNANPTIGDRTLGGPVNRAASQHHWDIVRMLLETSGTMRVDMGDFDVDVDVDALGWQGRTPLHDAAQQGDMDAVLMLLGFGANRDPLDQNNLTPAMLARQNGHWDVVHRLCSHATGLRAVGELSHPYYGRAGHDHTGDEDEDGDGGEDEDGDGDEDEDEDESESESEGGGEDEGAQSIETSPRVLLRAG